MEFERVLQDRYSCRAFLPDAVPADAMVRLFAMAQRTASWCNTQPWQVHVTTGQETGRFAKALTEHVLQGQESPDFEMPRHYGGVYQERRREAGYALYRALDIAREDRAARAHQALKNFSFFGAPHTAVITTDRDQGIYGAIDCGAYVGNLLHAAEYLGIATIAQASIARYATFVRSHLAIPDDRMLVCAVSFGYADSEHPANQFRTSRAPMGEVLHVVGANGV